MNKKEMLYELLRELNSYGSMFDLIEDLQRGLQNIKANNKTIPYELLPAKTLSRKLMSFLEDNGIKKIFDVGEQIDVSMSNINCFEYYGTPFETREELKKVEVLSSGWETAEGDILVYPRVREICQAEKVKHGVNCVHSNDVI